MSFEDVPMPKLPRCRTCGGYGYNFPAGQKSAQICPSCNGDKISRDPHDYVDKRDIPPRR